MVLWLSGFLKTLRSILTHAAVDSPDNVISLALPEHMAGVMINDKQKETDKQ